MMKVLGIALCIVLLSSTIARGETMKEETVALPKPSYEGKMSVEEAIKSRRTVRSFSAAPLTLSQLSQLLWSAQGITDEKRGFRSAPSGGALYPLDVYVAVGKNGVEQLAGGVYRYLPESHALAKTAERDRRKDVARVALGQSWMAEAPVMFVITAEYRRITGKYGNRGVRYATIEVGHVGQNIFLQAGALGLGAGIVGAFDDAGIAEVIGAKAAHEPLLIMPVGYKE